MAGSSSNADTTVSQEPTESNSVQLSKEEIAAKVVNKRYEGLVLVRSKAIKGKGAWYWAYLEPVLVHNSESGQPRAAKLRCLLCDSFFSASNPSRTASEHLKRGTCPNYNLLPKPVSDPVQDPGLGPTLSSPSVKHRKRNSRFSGGGSGGRGCSGGIGTNSTQNKVYNVDASRHSVELAYTPAASSGGDVGGGGVVFSQQHSAALSGGKEDLNALAMFEDSVKKLKSPKASSPALSSTQIESAFDSLADWVYECCGSVSLSCLDHPKFKAFLNQVGLPPLSQQELCGERLDAKYEAAKAESEARIRDAMFFQIASDGWKSNSDGHVGAENNVVNLSLNLPNGTSVFQKSVLTNQYVSSKYAEEVFVRAISEICSNNVQQCVGIVADKFKAKALRNLENQHHWMVNLSCQFQGFNSLIKDLSKELSSFKSVIGNCSRLAIFINSNSQVRNIFFKYQLQAYGRVGLLRVPSYGYETLDFGPVYAMLEDMLSSARALELMLNDDSYKVISMEKPLAQEIEKIMRNPHFWHEIDAVHSLVKLIKGMAQEIETERPRVGQCLPLWEELRVNMKDWCSKFKIGEVLVDKVIERRFRKNYHPAWAAAFVLDPLYLVREASGKYLPPFRYLTPEQEKDVDKLIIRLVSREEAHIALMELMKWRTEGLDPVYAQAVQLKHRDPTTGKMKIANPHSSRLVWETYLSEFQSLRKVAVRLIFLHATSFGFKCNVSLSKWASSLAHTSEGIERAQKLVYIASHSKLEKRDFSQDEDKDVELFSITNGEDDMPNDVFIDASTI